MDSLRPSSLTMPPSRTRRLVALALVLLLAAPACRRLRPQPTVEDGKESVYPFLSHGSVAVAEGMLENRWDLGNRFPVVTIAPLTWTEDPFNDNYWRFLFYSLRPTSNLLWAYYTTGQARYRDKLLEILSSYAAYDAARPAAYDRLRLDYRHGAGFRALVLVNTYLKLRRSGDLPPALAQSLYQSIAKLGAFLALPENFDASYNHGFAEAAGLAAIAFNFPELASAPAWKDVALERLDALMANAVDADGVELENSPFYHFYVLGFAYDISSWARRYGIPISTGFEDAVWRMVRYATLIVQPDGQLPLLGATVEYGTENLDQTAFEALAGERPAFEWIYTSGAAGAPPDDAERAVVFPVSGQAILRSGFGTGPSDFGAESQVTVNSGPWRTTHSHLDVLGLALFAGGRRLLCDSGLYTYTQGAELDYFTSTRAHNTVVVDGGDQLPSGAIGVGTSSRGSDWEYSSGWHQLYPGVTHRRAVMLLGRRAMLVVDALDGDAAHDFAQVWHLPAGYAASVSGLDVDAGGADPAVSIRQAWPGSLTLAAITGATDPMQGWVSTRYGVKDAATALEYHSSGASVRFATLVVAGADAAHAPGVAATEGAGGALQAVACAHGTGWAIALSGPPAAGESVTVTAAPAGACP